MSTFLNRLHRNARNLIRETKAACFITSFLQQGHESKCRRQCFKITSRRYEAKSALTNSIRCSRLAMEYRPCPDPISKKDHHNKNNATPSKRKDHDLRHPNPQPNNRPRREYIHKHRPSDTNRIHLHPPQPTAESGSYFRRCCRWAGFCCYVDHGGRVVLYEKAAEEGVWRW